MSDSELEYLLSFMDIPIQRKTTMNKSNLCWLQKNLGLKNSNHEKYETIMNEIDRRIQEKDYMR